MECTPYRPDRGDHAPKDASIQRARSRVKYYVRGSAGGT